MEKREQVIKELIKNRRCYIIFRALMYIGLILPCIFAKGPIKMLVALVAGFVISIIFRAIAAEYKLKLKRLYKKEFVKKTLLEEFQDVEYKWQRGFTEMQVYDFMLMKYSGFRSEDYLKASYNGKIFEWGEVSYYRYRNIGYAGAVLSIDRPFIDINGLWITSVGGGNDFFVESEIDKNIECVVLDDEELSGKFYFWAYKNVIESKDLNKVITPKAKETLYRLKKEFPCFKMSFIKGKINIWIDWKEDIFDNIFIGKKVVWEEEQQRIREQVKKIVLLLDIVLG